VGRARLLDLAAEIADFREQVSWVNSPEEQRRLRDKIRYIPAHVGIRLDSLRLSKASDAKMHSALWSTLMRAFPSLDIKPT
jgi:hypothetical protein